MMDQLIQFLKLLWGMPKHIQDEYFRSTVKGKKGQPWRLMGKRIGPKCCVAILGVGNCRMARVEQGRMDRRYSVWGGAPRLVLSIFAVFCAVHMVSAG